MAVGSLTLTASWSPPGGSATRTPASPPGTTHGRLMVVMPRSLPSWIGHGVPGADRIGHVTGTARILDRAPSREMGRELPGHLSTVLRTVKTVNPSRKLPRFESSTRHQVPGRAPDQPKHWSGAFFVSSSPVQPGPALYSRPWADGGQVDLGLRCRAGGATAVQAAVGAPGSWCSISYRHSLHGSGGSCSRQSCPHSGQSPYQRGLCRTLTPRMVATGTRAVRSAPWRRGGPGPWGDGGPSATGRRVAGRRPWSGARRASVAGTDGRG